MAGKIKMCGGRGCNDGGQCSDCSPKMKDIVLREEITRRLKVISSLSDSEMHTVRALAWDAISFIINQPSPRVTDDEKAAYDRLETLIYKCRDQGDYSQQDMLRDLKCLHLYKKVEGQRDVFHEAFSRICGKLPPDKYVERMADIETVTLALQKIR